MPSLSRVSGRTEGAEHTLGLQETRQPGSGTPTPWLLLVFKSANPPTFSIFKAFPVFKERDALKCFPG